VIILFFHFFCEFSFVFGGARAASWSSFLEQLLLDECFKATFQRNLLFPFFYLCQCSSKIQIEYRNFTCQCDIHVTSCNIQSCRIQHLVSQATRHTLSLISHWRKINHYKHYGSFALSLSGLCKKYSESLFHLILHAK
jgi:hypothetical protein